MKRKLGRVVGILKHSLKPRRALQFGFEVLEVAGADEAVNESVVSGERDGHDASGDQADRVCAGFDFISNGSDGQGDAFRGVDDG